VILLCYSSLISFAQKGDTLEIQRSEKNSITFARFKPNGNRKMYDGAEFLETVLSAKENHRFKLVKVKIDELGISYRRYQQYYKGVKVENAEYLIHGKNSVIETINGDFQKVSISTVTPYISEEKAITATLYQYRMIQSPLM